jgi:hypothetical protein
LDEISANGDLLNQATQAQRQRFGPPQQASLVSRPEEPQLTTPGPRRDPVSPPGGPRRGDAQIFRGTSVLISDNVHLEIGHKTFLNSISAVTCFDHITIGSDCAISWNTNMLDGNAHDLVVDGVPRPRTQRQYRRQGVDRHQGDYPVRCDHWPRRGRGRWQRGNRGRA